MLWPPGNLSETMLDPNDVSFPPCKIKAKFRAVGSVVLLASFPGSGNTWTRYLLEQYSGILTGSVYYDVKLFSELRGEGVYDGTVIAIKTHGFSVGPGVFDFITETIDFDKAILIVRDPKDTIVAEISRLFTDEDHIEVMDEDKWYTEEVQRQMISLAFKLTLFIQHWLLTYSGPLLVVQYELLRADPLAEMERIMSYLEHPPNDKGVACLKVYNGGQFKRKPKPYEPFLNVTTIDAINLAVITTSQLLKKFDIRYEVTL